MVKNLIDEIINLHFSVIVISRTCTFTLKNHCYIYIYMTFSNVNFSFLRKKELNSHTKIFTIIHTPCNNILRSFTVNRVYVTHMSFKSESSLNN